MSIPESARAPAWSGLQPDEGGQYRVCGSWARRIVTAIGRPGQLLGRSADACRSEGYYTFVPEDGSRRLFLKTVHERRLASQLDANRIAEWLADNALPVRPILNSYPRRLDSHYYLIAHNLIDGRFARCEAPDLEAIGQLLGRTHNALQSLPAARHIRRRSAQRDALFTELLHEQHQAPATNESVRKVLASSTPQLPSSDAQVIHGDLNMGNLLIGKASGQPALLDFEDANHNWHSPLVDLAMALERFVLVRTPDAELADRLGRALIEGYLATAQQRPAVEHSATKILQSLATRALLLLGNSAPSPTVDAERDKFLMLHALAEQQGPLLDRLWQSLDGR